MAFESSQSILTRLPSARMHSIPQDSNFPFASRASGMSRKWASVTRAVVGSKMGSFMRAAGKSSIYRSTPSYNVPMFLLRCLSVIILLSAISQAQQRDGGTAVSGPVSMLAAPERTGTADIVATGSSRPAVPEHSFWDRENLSLFSGIVLTRGMDYASTLNFQARGRQEILLPDDVVNNSAGFAGLEAAATASSIGVSYLLHRTGHHKLERWVSIAHISVAGFGDTRNYLLQTRHAVPLN